MTAAELRSAIEALGLTQGEAADLCLVSERTVRRWLARKKPVPPLVAEKIRNTLQQKEQSR